MNGRAQTEDVEGVVESVNANGLKIGGAWVNVSRFHPVQLPEAPGAHVRLKIDSKGYIVELENLSLVPPVLSDKDERITRLAVLRSAVQLAARRSDLKSTDVLRIAELFEEWVNR